MLNNDQIHFVHNCFRTWISVAAAAGYDVNQGMKAGQGGNLAANIDHSALLGRLLSGKMPLPQPPPTAFSYPWYSLIVMGFERNNEVTVYADRYPDDIEWGGKVNINQSLWDFVAKGTDYVIARWPKTGLMVKCTKHTDDKFAPFNWKVEIIDNKLA